jgi:hypothetical protein
VFPEHELFDSFDDVLLIIGIVLVESRDQIGFNEALLVKSALILENFHGDEFLLFVVKRAQHDSKRAFAQLLDDFVPIAEVFVVAMNVLLLVSVEAVIGQLVEFSVRVTSRLVFVTLRLQSFLYVEEVDCIVLEDLLLFNFPQVRS